MGQVDLVVENFEKKLPMLRRNYLYLVGRITLIKSITSNLLVHYKMPQRVGVDLDCIRRNLLWDGQRKRSYIY